MTMFDVHTHHSGAHDAIINLDPGKTPEPGRLYSAGIHPWYAADPAPGFEELAARPEVVAIGEAGFDRLRGPAPEVQRRAFERCVAVSERLRKPMILHVVRAFDIILAEKKRLRPSQPWIIHGFRGKPALARQLLEAGFYLSYGEGANPASVAATPPDRLLVETDEAAALPDIPADPTLPARLFGIKTWE